MVPQSKTTRSRGSNPKKTSMGFAHLPMGDRPSTQLACVYSDSASSSAWPWGAYVCVCVCKFVYVYTHMLYIHVYMHIFIHVYIYIYICVCMCVLNYAYIYIHIYVCVSVHKWTNPQQKGWSLFITLSSTFHKDVSRNEKAVCPSLCGEGTVPNSHHLIQRATKLHASCSYANVICWFQRSPPPQTQSHRL